MSGRGRIAAWLGAAALASGCATRPEPAPAPVLRPAPPPPVPAPPEPSAEPAPAAPLTPGDWSYAGEAGGSVATFGPGRAALFSLRCDTALRRVSILVQGEPRPLRLLTSFGQRTLAAGAALSAGDPLLDEIVFSRGHFTVEGGGPRALILPTWPEPARVIEDCRG